jgi:enamine deaminase RidA (YjgF/YER057c/UK114 family)
MAGLQDMHWCEGFRLARMERMTLTRIPAPEGVAPATRYTHVVSGTGRFVAIAGQVALDEKGELVGEGDPLAQVRQVFVNLRRCLAAAGATFADVIKVTYFFTAPDVLEAVRAAKDELDDWPEPSASTAVQIAALFDPRFVIEIEAFAVVPE